MVGLWTYEEDRSTVFYDGINVGYEKKIENVQEKSKVFGLSNWKDKVAIS